MLPLLTHGNTIFFLGVMKHLSVGLKKQTAERDEIIWFFDIGWNKYINLHSAIDTVFDFEKTARPRRGVLWAEDFSGTTSTEP